MPVSEIKFFHEGNASCNTVSTSFNSARIDYSPNLGLSSDGGIHMVGAEDVGGGLRDIFYSHSTDSGVTFLPADSPVNLSATPSDSTEPLLGFEGSLNVDAVWVEGSSGARSVTLVRSTDMGDSFSTPQTLSDSDVDAHCPVIATHGADKVYAAYKGDSDIYFTRWQAATSSFSSPENISLNASSPSCPKM